MCAASLSATHNTAETGNSQGHGALLSESYHLTCFSYFEAFLLFIAAPQFLKGLHPTHDHSALGLLLLVVVRLMTHGDLLLLDFSSKFAVDMEASARSGQRAILKDPAHVVEQAGGRQHDGGRMEAVLVLQKELRVLVSLAAERLNQSIA